MTTTRLATNSPRPEPLPFEKVSGNAWPDDYEDECGLWRHARAIDAEGPIWLYIQVMELPSDCREPFGHRWCASLIGVSPFFSTDESIRSALESCGDHLEDCWNDLNDAQREMALCETLISVGVQMNVIDKTSSRAKGAYKGCATAANIATMMWGFIADRQANAVGNSGWDFLKGTYGWGKQDTRKPNEFQATVIAWLNTFYPERVEYHASEE